MFRFGFGSAFGHFTKSPGPAGFVWKYVLSYAVLGSVLAGIVGAMMAPTFMKLSAIGFDDANPEMESIFLSAVPMVILMILVGMVAGGLFWAVFEGAGMRRYIRKDGFSLKIGADEGRLIVVGLIWIGMSMAIGMATSMVQMVVMLIVMGVTGGFSGDPTATAAASGIATLLTMPIGLIQYYFMVRWSAASALTIRDREIRFFESWRLTRGRVLPMFGAYIVQYLTIGLISGLVFIVMAGATLYPVLAPLINRTDVTPQEVFGLLMQPLVLTGLGVTYIVSLLGYAVMSFAMQGVPAAAVRDDPQMSENAMEQVFS